MHFTKLLVSLALLPAVLAAPPNKCRQPSVRKEWRQLSIPQRHDFIRALKCMHSKPAQLRRIYPGTTTRYEDFAQTHKVKTPYSHLTGFFLSWHRLFLQEFEYALQTECRYKGTLPYWDYTIDAYEGGNFTASEIFDPVHGFGGNGAYDSDPAISPPGSGMWGGGCVYTGPFKDWIFHVSRGGTTEYVTRCFTRNFWVAFQHWSYKDKEDIVYEQTNYQDMVLMLEGDSSTKWDAIHAGGHFMVGGIPFTGTGSEVWTAPLEPLFWLHHANIDRIYAKWQDIKPEYKWAVGGDWNPRVPNRWGNDSDWDFKYEPVKIRDPVDLGKQKGKYVKAKLGQLLSTRGETAPGNLKGILCYEYSTPPPPPPRD